MTCLILFYEFFKVGLFSFGGGAGMIPLIEEMVTKYSWLSEEEFYNLIGICESTPGPIAVNMATYVGSTQAGAAGSLLATLGVVLPSFLIILLVASVMKSLTENRWFRGFMRGVSPVILGLIFSTGAILMLKSLGYVSLREFRPDITSLTILLLLAGFFFLLPKLTGKKVGAVPLILFSAAAGIGVSVLYEALGILS